MAQTSPETAQDTLALAPPRHCNRPAQAEPELFAALDLGTNSCRMLIAQPDGGHFRVVDAFAKSVRLGMGLERTGHLSRGAIARTIQALDICADKLRRFGVQNMRLVATEACRRARNGNHFLALVTRETGLRLELIRPEEEARLAVISCAPLVAPEASQVLVFDIGGGSTELVWIDLAAVAPEERAQAIVNLQFGGGAGSAARIVDFISVPLGVATLHDRFADVADDSARFALMSWFFEEQIAGFKPYLDIPEPETSGGFQMIGTSGTVTTVGAAHLGLRRYDRRKVDGMSLSAEAIDAVIARFLRLGPEGRRNDAGLGPRPLRADHVGGGDPPDAAAALAHGLDPGGGPRAARGDAVRDDEREGRLRGRRSARSDRGPVRGPRAFVGRRGFESVGGRRRRGGLQAVFG
jgi:exopolyphosphatase/guanosine-5'-triphosphate,3'-diphosphate pyrophosphatase